MNSLFDIRERVIILTGGYGILGACMAKHLAKEGATVVILGRDPRKGAALVDAIRAEGGEALFVPADVLDKPSLERSEETILAKDTVYLAQYLRPSRTEPARQTIALDSFTYRVKSGDTLSGIAKKHHVTVAQLMKWNNLKSANRLRVGQTLEIYR